MLATAGRLHFHLSVEFICWRQQVAFTSTLQWNSLIGDSRSPSLPLFSGIQLTATAGRIHLHNMSPSSVLYSGVQQLSTAGRISIVGDSRSPSHPLFSGFQLMTTAGRLHIHISVEFNCWRQQVAFIVTLLATTGQLLK